MYQSLKLSYLCIYSPCVLISFHWNCGTVREDTACVLVSLVFPGGIEEYTWEALSTYAFVKGVNDLTWLLRKRLFAKLVNNYFLGGSN